MTCTSKTESVEAAPASELIVPVLIGVLLVLL